VPAVAVTDANADANADLSARSILERPAMRVQRHQRAAERDGRALPDVPAADHDLSGRATLERPAMRVQRH